MNEWMPSDSFDSWYFIIIVANHESFGTANYKLVFINTNLFTSGDWISYSEGQFGLLLHWYT